MATVTGNLKDIVNQAMGDRQGELVFRLSDPSIAAVGANAGTIYPTAEQRVVPSSTGAFTVNLQTTTSLLNDAWYTLQIEWLDDEGGVMDFPGWQIRVGVDGGSIDKLITFGPPGGGWGGQLPNLSLVLVSLTKPDNLQVGQLWLQAAPEAHDSPDQGLNTGKLYRGIG
ncbi:hypothetical protein [Glutamicibacter sp. PS]|uniref:hypothetical protein n=1 Tax=Glutamicibacter sp. PS TaxID=3075634 RepID=UPI00284F04E1|nr:hypothetical protein [Glutamicibacter sp. PS]MDR4533202.1 hypothetical protein [Glutamicibacter sp. PS]